MGSSEFLYALLSTLDSKYKKNFSIRTRVLLNFCNFFFPNYVKIGAKSRLELKESIINSVKKFNPDIIIELGAGHSIDYLNLIEKRKIGRLIQIDIENIPNYNSKEYQFIQGDITKENVWNKFQEIQAKKGVIISEGLFSYLNNEEFNFVIDRIKGMTLKGFSLITHEPLKPISFSRRIISLFIGKTYRRFNSLNEIKEYYKSKGLKIKVIKENKFQVIYRIYK